MAKLPRQDNAETRKKFDLQARILNRREASYIRDIGTTFRRKSKDGKASRGEADFWCQR